MNVEVHDDDNVCGFLFLSTHAAFLCKGPFVKEASLSEPLIWLNKSQINKMYLYCFRVVCGVTPGREGT